MMVFYSFSANVIRGNFGQISIILPNQLNNSRSLVGSFSHLFQPEVAGFGGKILHKSENHS